MIKKKYINKIEKQLFFNYVKIFVIESIIVIILLFISNNFVNNYINNSLYNPDTLFNKICEFGLGSINTEDLPKNVYAEMLDNNYTVIDSINSPHNKGYTYSQKERLDFDSSVNIMFYEDENLDNETLIRGIYIIKSPWQDKLLLMNNLYNVITIGILILCIFITFIILSKSNAREFIIPIKKLLKGMNEFQNHNYKYKIDFNYNNELDELKNTFNNMSTSLHNEFTLRKKAEKNKEQLVLDITHDIKTPLTNISGYCEILKNNSLDCNTKNNYLDIIIANSNRINILMHSLHDISHTNKDTLSLSITDISEMLRELIIEYIPIIENIPMSYSINIPDETVYCNIDTNRIRRAISNIINNSIKYSGKNTSLFINMYVSISNVTIIIKDTGKGMNETLANTAFEPFVRGDTARSTHVEGSGIGLTISKKLIEMHGGNIILDTNTHKGCKIIIVLPIHSSLCKLNLS